MRYHRSLLSLMGSDLAGSGSILEPAGIGSVRPGRSFHHLLTEATPVAASLPKPGCANPMHCAHNLNIKYQSPSGSWIVACGFSDSDFIVPSEAKLAQPQQGFYADEKRNCKHSTKKLSLKPIYYQNMRLISLQVKKANYEIVLLFFL